MNKTEAKIIQITNRFNAVQSDYVKLMAEHIRDIGKLTADDVANIASLEQYSRMEKNLKTITDELMQVSNKTIKDMEKIYKDTSNELYKKAEIYYKWQGVEQVAIEQNSGLMDNIQSAVNKLSQSLITIVDSASRIIKTDYAKAIDDAVEVVASGKATYTKEITNIIKQCAGQGVRVQYPSGYTRRLDSSVRMNLLDGVRSIRNNQARLIGEQFGADGVEIDAHGMCAEDHQPYQGRQFAWGPRTQNNKNYKHFDSLDTGRPIGELNCQHGLTYIILGVSDPVYSKEEIKRMNDYSNEKIKYGDKEITRYEASQVMRKLETKMRDVKTSIIATGSKDLKETLNRTKILYNEIAKKAGLPLSPSRASVPGFRG